MKRLSRLLGIAGLVALLALTLRSGAGAIGTALGRAGSALWWMLPLHAVALALDANGWRTLIGLLERPAPRLHRLCAIAAVREAVNRLLPVANLGGEVVGIRLLAARGAASAAGMPGARAAASVVVEILMTLASQYLFAVLGVACLVHLRGRDAWTGQLLLGLGAMLPLLLGIGLLLRRGDLFARLARFVESSIGVREQWRALTLHTTDLDQSVRALCRAHGRLAATVAWQLACLFCTALENYWVLQRLQTPVPLAGAIAIESLAQVIRNFIFVVPAGVGVQEAGLVAIGGLLGVPAPTAVALSLIKRGREILFGLPPLLLWQWHEARRGSASERKAA